MHSTNLPSKLPLLPLNGVVLLPGGYLPLNISLPNQIAIIDEAMKSGRLLGLVQPRADDGSVSQFYSVGCMGRITGFTEIAPALYQITVLGVCRFDLIGELASNAGFFNGLPRWDRFLSDLATPFEKNNDIALWRDQLEKAVELYFKALNLGVDMDALKGLDGEKLVVTLSMICPFTPSERQALLEATNMDERTKVLMSMLEMSLIAKKENLHGAKH